MEEIYLENCGLDKMFLVRVGDIFKKSINAEN
jgi:hypothetical protein